MTPIADTGAADAADLGIKLAQANAVAFVVCARSLPADECVEFVRAFLACISGVAQQAIGHQATAQAFRDTAELCPVAPPAAR